VRISSAEGFPGGCFFASAMAELDCRRQGRSANRIAECQHEWMNNWSGPRTTPGHKDSSPPRQKKTTRASGLRAGGRVAAATVLPPVRRSGPTSAGPAAPSRAPCPLKLPLTHWQTSPRPAPQTVRTSATGEQTDAREQHDKSGHKAFPSGRWLDEGWGRKSVSFASSIDPSTFRSTSRSAPTVSASMPEKTGCSTWHAGPGSPSSWPPPALLLSLRYRSSSGGRGLPRDSEPAECGIRVCDCTPCLGAWSFDVRHHLPGIWGTTPEAVAEITPCPSPRRNAPDNGVVIT